MDTNAKNLITGMTDFELEAACEIEINNGSLWYDWTSEIYGFGKCYRFMTNYPRLLPLFIKSDHGVGLESGLFPHEFKSNNKVHLTWNSLKESRYKDYPNLNVIRIPHPWVYYRKEKSIIRNERTRGTIVFFTHHVPGVKWEGHDTEEYFTQLRELPDKFQPVVLCLHMHDINAGNHIELRRHGFPLVTVGNTSSTKFVDRFYKLVKDFSYASSPDWGSQVAYCVELGVPYFFLGKRPKLINVSHDQMPLGEVMPQDEAHTKMQNQVNALFNVPVDKVTSEQLKFVHSKLGLDSKVTPRQISYILWRELFRHFLEWHLIVKSLLLILMRNSGFLNLLISIKRFNRN